MKQLYFSGDSLGGLPGLVHFGQTGTASSGGVQVMFEAGRPRPGVSLRREGEAFRIHYARPCDAYRGIGLLLAGYETAEQDCAHETLGVMWDLSRNGVLRVEAWQRVLKKLALLGYNSVQLYMEDVYALPDEPFFGYGRGAYSAEELRQIDDFGHQLGIEIIPCIQTLGHLEQALQWPPYSALRDQPAILLVGEEGTKRLIAKMLDHLSACFRTRNIHIGMDEAHGIGQGEYLKKHGLRRSFDILTEHLRLVVELCRERGLKPMMWSDMFFRIGSNRNDYYDLDSVIPDDVKDAIPAEVELVYWDYYHADAGFYHEWIRRHRALGKEPIFAAGAWNWGRFWAFEPRWRESIEAGMKAAREEKLAHAVLTIWGDDGDEYHLKSVLPTVLYFAEWAYAGAPDSGALERLFGVIQEGAPLSYYLQAAKLDQPPASRGLKECTINHSKWILWQDAVLGHLDAHITPDLPEHYRMLADELASAPEDEAVAFAATIARAVAAKAELHMNARAAWRRGDTAELARLHREVLPRCLEAVRTAWEAHRASWHEWRKPFGWEVIEARYATCAARLEALGALLEKCLNETSCSVPEWEFEPQEIEQEISNVYFTYQRAKTPTMIK